MSTAQHRTLRETLSYRRLVAIVLLLAAGARAQQVVLTAPVDSISAPGAATLILAPSTSSLNVIYNFSLPTITGPGARMFGVSSSSGPYANTCSGTVSGSGTCTVYVQFAPTYSLPAGQSFTATLNLPFILCQTQIVSGSPSGSPDCQSSNATFSLQGTPTGTQSSYTGAEIQITPTQPVLLQPGSYGQELAKDAQGNVFASIADTIVEFTPAQAYTPNSTPAVIAGNGGQGGTGDGQLATQAGISPYGIVPIGGTIFAVDNGQGVVRDFSVGGDINLFLGVYGQSCVILEQTFHIGMEYSGGCYNYVYPGTELVNPSSLATDGLNLYINDAASDTIREFSVTSNSASTLAGYAGLPYFFEGYNTVNVYPGYSGDGGLASQAQINSPGGMAVDSNSNLYLAEGYSNVIRKIDISNTISTFLGQGPGVSGSYPVGSGNGPAAQATFNYPVALTFDPLGNMYIFDQSGYALREVQINAGVPGNINTLYSLATTPYPPPSAVDSGTPVMDNTGEILVSSAGYPTPGIYELLGSGLLKFPTVEIGTPTTLTATITNPGLATLELMGTSISGTNGADFTLSPTITATSCGSSVVSGGSCTITVIYNPTAQSTALTRTATLYLTTNVGTGTQVIALTGTTYTELALAKGGITYTPYYNWPNVSTAVAYVAASGGVPPYTFTDTISSASGDWYFNSGTTTASISGAPLVVGSIPYSITVTDSMGTQATYSGNITSQTAPSSVYIAASQSSSTTGTTATLTGAVNPGESLSPGAVLPSGSVQISQDGGLSVPYPLNSAAAIPATTFNFDILYHTLTATYNGDANYSATNFPQTLTFNGNHAQAITFTGGGLSAAVGSVIALTAYASSGLPVMYAVLTGPGTIDSSGTNLVLNGPGTVVVQASQAGNTSFAPATSVTASFISH